MERWKQIMLAGVAAMGIWLIGGVRAEAAVPINEVIFPDSAVRAHVKVYDKNNDGMLSDEVALFNSDVISPLPLPSPSSPS